MTQGMERCGWAEVPILAMETEGAASFNASVKAGKLVTLTEMTRYYKLYIYIYIYIIQFKN